MMGQPPPRPPIDPKIRIEIVRHRFAERPPVGAEQERLAAFGAQYLKEAAAALQANEKFKAERLIEAAEACRRPIEHLQHIEKRQGPVALPPGPVPLAVHLRQVYFRLRLADVFLKEIHPPAPIRLLELARSFYARALESQRAKEDRIAEEYAAAANDLTHALEHLAQASIASAP
jgi:hypothetical protein